MMTGDKLDLPRLPALGWATFTGPKRSPLPSILDARDIRFTTSGRAAIALALNALRVGPGDRVLVPTYHCPTMIAPVVAAGATPVFFPIDERGAPRFDPIDERVMRGVRAMIVAHYFGLPQPMAQLRKFCDDRAIALIEDCAHSLFGMSDGRPVGQWGDYAIASLTKFLPVSDGGCLVARRDLGSVTALAPRSLGAELKSLANAVELGAQHGRLTGINRILSGLFGLASALRARPIGAEPADAAAPIACDVERWLADFGPGSAANCAVSIWTRWIARHAHRERIVTLRRRNYARLVRLVAGMRGVRALQPALPEASAPYVFPLWVDRPGAAYQEVRDAGIPVFRWDEPWPGRPAIAGDCGIAWATHVFQIGCHQDLNENDLVDMVRTLDGIIGRRSIATYGRRETSLTTG